MQPPEQITVIKAPSRWDFVDFTHLWEYRELLFFLVWRDVKVRYKQTALGVSWAILQPLFSMIVFTIFFGRIAGIESDGIPYPVFSYTALLPWTFFAQGLTQSSGSLVSSANLIRKVYFPRVIIPVSSVLAGVVDFLLAFSLLFILMAYYNVWPNRSIIWLPLLFLLAFSTVLGVGMWLSALYVKYRDVKYIAPFIIQMWLFVTPVIYPASIVTSRLESANFPGWIYGLNPMVGVVEGFRWALLGTQSQPYALIVASGVVSALLLISGLFVFNQMEKSFADVV